MPSTPVQAYPLAVDLEPSKRHCLNGPVGFTWMTTHEAFSLGLVCLASLASCRFWISLQFVYYPSVAQIFYDEYAE